MSMLQKGKVSYLFKPPRGQPSRVGSHLAWFSLTYHLMKCTYHLAIHSTIIYKGQNGINGFFEKACWFLWHWDPLFQFICIFSKTLARTGMTNYFCSKKNVWHIFSSKKVYVHLMFLYLLAQVSDVDSSDIEHFWDDHQVCIELARGGNTKIYVYSNCVPWIALKDRCRIRKTIPWRLLL